MLISGPQALRLPGQGKRQGAFLSVDGNLELRGGRTCPGHPRLGPRPPDWGEAHFLPNKAAPRGPGLEHDAGAGLSRPFCVGPASQQAEGTPGPDGRGKGRARPRLRRKVWDPLLAPCPRVGSTLLESSFWGREWILSSGAAAQGKGAAQACPSPKALTPPVAPTLPSSHSTGSLLTAGMGGGTVGVPGLPTKA